MLAKPARRSAPDRCAAEPASSGPGWLSYLKALGPGLVTGASDDDPSGVATYAQAGAQFRLGLLWTTLLTLPLMAAVQEICDRTALATGKALGELALRKFPRLRTVLAILIGALLVANMLNVAADVVAVGSGMQLLGAGSGWIWGLVAGLGVSALVMAGSFEIIANIFKLLCAALLSYLVVLLVTHVAWGSVASHLLIPHLTVGKDSLLLLVAVLGTTISSYLFFWQSAHRVEELRAEPEGGDRATPIGELTATKERHKERASRADVFVGMTFSNVVMFAIIVATAATIGKHHGVTIDSAAQAAQALEPAAGSSAKLLFALGFIGSGMLAIPVLAGSGAAGMAGLLHKDWGFSRSVREAPLFYVLVLVGTVGGTALSILNVNPIRLLVYVAAINGVLAAPFLFIVMRISGDAAIMGEHTNGRLARILGWTTTAVMAIAALAYLTITYGP
jgi:NRAMP (natural resistance-associated macrophage protein)-like metal ion transporter